MNLSQVQVDLGDEPQADIKPKLQAEEARLLRIIEAVQGLSSSKEWSTLKTEVFDNLVNSLERDLRDEAKKTNPDPLKLNRIAGEMKWAERFSDFNKFEQAHRIQLQQIRLKLYGNTE